MNKNVRQIFLPVVTAFVWGMAFVAQDYCADKIGVFQTLVERNFAGFFAMLVVLYAFRAISKKKKTRAAANSFRSTDVQIHKVSKTDSLDEGTTQSAKATSAPETKSSSEQSRKTLVIGSLCLGLPLFVGMYLQQVGIILGTEVGKAGFLTSLYVVIVPLLGIAIGEKPSLKLWASVLVAVLGLYFLSIKGDFSLALEDALVLSCAVAFAIYIQLAAYFSVRCDSIALSTYQLLVAGIISIPFFLITETFSWEMFVSTLPSILYLGVFSSAIGFTLQIIAQKGTNTTVVTLLMSLESVFAAFGGWILLGQVMSGRELFGAALMLAAVILAQVPAFPEKTRETSNIASHSGRVL